MDSARRDALKRIGKAGLVLGAAGAIAKLGYDPGGFGLAGPTARPQTRDFRLREGAGEAVDMAVAKVGTPADLTRRAVDALGGMNRFISRGDVVVVKPNIGWDRTPIHAANTNPEVVAEVVRMAYDAGAKTVVVTDASCNEPNRCFQRSGIWRHAYQAGAEVIIPAEHRFRTMRLNGEVLSEWPVYTVLVNCDKIINVPIAKHHNLSKYTAAMKNWYGSLNVADTKQMQTVIASTDQVAVDAYGCQLIGRKPEEIAYIKMAHERGLGTMHWESLRRVDA